MKSKLFWGVAPIFDNGRLCLSLRCAKLCPQVHNILSDLLNMRDPPIVFFVNAREFVIYRVDV